MRYLGVNQHFQTKVPVSEFDGLTDRLNLQGLKIYKGGCKESRGYYSQTTDFTTARNSNGGTSSGDGYFGIDGTSSSCTIYQTYYAFDVSWWQSSFQLAGAVVELRCESGSTINNTTNPSNLYLLGVLTKFTEYKGWATMSSASGFANLGKLLLYPPDNNTVNVHHGKCHEHTFLSFRITNVSGFKALLDAAVATTAKEIYLYPASYHYVDNIAPTANFYFYALYSSIELYYS